MPEHRLLTGNQLHEPKGIESASPGTVYVADGNGSGQWIDPFASLYNVNQLFPQQTIEQGSAYFVPSITGQIKEFGIAVITPPSADATFSLYVNGNLATPTTGSIVTTTPANTVIRVTLSTGVNIARDSVIEVRCTDTTTVGNLALLSLDVTG